MIKILQVSSDTNIGGAGNVLINYLEQYDRSSFDVSVVLPRNSLLKARVEERGVRVIEVDGMADRSLDWPDVKTLRRLFKAEKPDIVHTHASMSARIAARLSGVPAVLYTRHSVFPPSKKISQGVGKIVNGFVNNITADAIVAVAEAAKLNLTDTGVSPKKIAVILNGIRPLKEVSSGEKERLREKFGLLPGERAVTISARLDPVKGHDTFVKAAKIVLDRGLPVKFFIAGTGECEASVKKQVEQLGLLNKIIVTGFINNVSELLNVTDILANCSFGTEATSLALLEGMCLGKPAVVTDFGGNPGVVSDGVNGFLVPIKNERAMAEKLIALLSNVELYEQMSKNCLEIFGRKFTSKAMTESLEELYRKTLSKKKQ